MNTVKLKLGSEAESIAGFLLWQVSRLWQRHLALALRDLKLPVTQAVVLGNVLRLNEEGLDVTQSRLSKVTKIDRTTTSQALQALEHKKLVVRVTPAFDLRVYQVRLSSRGRDMALEVIQRFALTHQAFFKPLENENDKVVDYLQRLIQANDL